MPSSLCEALLICILIVTLQVFEVMFVKFNFGGVSTIGNYISYTVYLFILLMCGFCGLVKWLNHLKESRYPLFFTGPVLYLSSYSWEEAKKQHYSRLIPKSNNKIKTTWNITKKETGKVNSVKLSLLTCEWWNIKGSNRWGKCL